VAGGPGRQALETELAHLVTFVTTQSQAWQERSDILQAKYEQCGQAPEVI
jgi:hypothetical protein